LTEKPLVQTKSWRRATAVFLAAFVLIMIAKTGNISYNTHEIRIPGKKDLRHTRPDKRKIYFIVKRGFDLGFSLVVIAGVLSWLMPVMAILIKLDSRGPVLFLQKRIGRGGRPFTCYKLRTMVVNEDADLCPASENDERVTRLGKILRKSHLDELPQFFNVFFGSMSLVGPRPYMLSDCHTFSEIVPDHTIRNIVKPGITGLAQVKGLHGNITDLQTIFSRYQWDAFYVRHGGFMMDLRILRRTIMLFLTQKMPLCK
jgi:lipopolysaccharide/colanic/teichoic acid biosynthesis glycosyltransferase